MPGSAAIGNLAVNLSLETAAFTSGATAAQEQMRGLAGAAQNMTHGFGSFSSSATNMRIVALELTHVTKDLGEQLAMGVSPLRAFTSEIGRIATAAQYAGGIGGLGRAIAGIVAPFAAAAAGAGILATAFLGVKQAADSTDMKAYIATLGLTDAQIKRLKDTTVTWGDVTKATFQVLAEKAGTSSGAISGAFSSAFHSVGDFGKFAASVVLAAFAAAVKGVYSLFANLPGIVGNAAVAAANLAVGAIENLVNIGTRGINSLSDKINNSLLGEAVQKVFGTQLPHMAEVSLGRIHTAFTGSFAKIGSDISGTFHDVFNRTEATFDQISARAVELREKNLAAQAAAMKSSDAAGKAAKGHEDRAKAIKKESDALADLLKGFDALLNKPQDVSDITKGQPPLVKSAADNAAFLKGQFDAVDAALKPVSDMFKARQGELLHFADEFGGAIASVVTGTESLKQAFSDLSRSIISEIIQMTVKMLIFRAITSAFGKFFGPTSIGPAATGGLDFGIDFGSQGTPGFANGGSGVFGGFGGVDQNVLSMNGSPIARVSRGEQFNVNPANNNNRAVTINQNYSFQGVAITQDEFVRGLTFAKHDTIATFKDMQRRA